MFGNKTFLETNKTSKLVSEQSEVTKNLFNPMVLKATICRAKGVQSLESQKVAEKSLTRIHFPPKNLDNAKNDQNLPFAVFNLMRSNSALEMPQVSNESFPAEAEEMITVAFSYRC